MSNDIRWRKSSHSGAGTSTNECVEVAVGTTQTGVRDSKNPQGAVLTFTDPRYRAFLAGLKQGSFNR